MPPAAFPGDLFHGDQGAALDPQGARPLTPSEPAAKCLIKRKTCVKNTGFSFYETIRGEIKRLQVFFCCQSFGFGQVFWVVDVEE